MIWVFREEEYFRGGGLDRANQVELADEISRNAQRPERRNYRKFSGVEFFAKPIGL